MQNWQNPGIKNVLAKCKNPPRPFSIPISQSANANSPFNPNGNAGTVYAGNPGTASAENSNSPHSVSEYDIACFQQTVH